MPVCTKCGKEKTGGAHRYWCNPCHAAWKRENRKRPEVAQKHRSEVRQYHLDHPEWSQDRMQVASRKRQLKRAGTNEIEYAAVLVLQDGKCAICQVDLEPSDSKSFKRQVPDHDHETGEFRGILCAHCNVGLGHLKDNVEILQRAIDYLTRKVALCRS